VSVLRKKFEVARYTFDISCQYKRPRARRSTLGRIAALRFPA
jgi:hypothetical protein